MAPGGAFDLSFRVRRARLADDTMLVAAAGELDGRAVQELARALSALDGRPAHRVVVDLTDVTFVDSSAFGALAAEARSRRHTGGEVAVVCGDGRTRRALDVTGIGSLLAVHRTLREALQA